MEGVCGGGRVDHEKGLTDTYLTEAHPDDLPSNALGALFAEEMLASAPDAPLLPAMRAFLAPLRPLPDSVSKRYTHDEVVLGLLSPVPKGDRSRQQWFTARPLLVARFMKDPAQRVTNRDAEAVLEEAGFAIATIQGRPIRIVRKSGE